MKKQTVRDYAEENYISRQAVYKKIDRGTLKTVKEQIDGKEVIFILVEEDGDKADHSTTIQPQDNPISTANNDVSADGQPQDNPVSTTIQPQDNQQTTDNTTVIQPYKEIIEYLKQELAEKKEELKQKDKVIEDIRQEAQQDRERLTKLLDQEQQLHAQTRLRLNRYEEEQSPIVEDEAPKEEVIINQEPKKKRNRFMRWLFGEE